MSKGSHTLLGLGLAAAAVYGFTKWKAAKAAAAATAAAPTGTAGLGAYSPAAVARSSGSPGTSVQLNPISVPSFPVSIDSPYKAQQLTYATGYGSRNWGTSSAGYGPNI